MKRVNQFNWGNGEKIQLIGQNVIQCKLDLFSLYFLTDLKTIDIVSSTECSACEQQELHGLLMINNLPLNCGSQNPLAHRWSNYALKATGG